MGLGNFADKNNMFGTGNQTSFMGTYGGPTQEDKSTVESAQLNNTTNAQNMWSTLFNAANKQYEDTAGVRAASIKRANDILSGNYNPSSSPAYAPMKRSTEQQYGASRNDILSSLPGGGTQQRALGNLAIAKGGKLSDTMSQILMNELNQGYNVANNSFPQTISAFSSALQGGAIPGQMISSLLEFLSKNQASAIQGMSGTENLVGSIL